MKYGMSSCFFFMAQTALHDYFRRIAFEVRLLSKHIGIEQGLSLEDINAEWKAYTRGEAGGISSKTWRRDKETINEIFDIFIDVRQPTKNRWVYFVLDRHDVEHNGLLSWTLSALRIIDLMAQAKALRMLILLNVFIVDTHIIETLLAAMIRRCKIVLTYKKHDKPQQEYTLAPYCIKQYNDRLYLLARKPNADMHIFSLDPRVVSIKVSNEPFVIPTDFDPQAYFADYFGVFVSSDYPPTPVVLRAYGPLRFYLNDAPIHSSQRSLPPSKHHQDFTLRLALTNDFIHYLLSRGSDLKVLAPQSLANHIRDQHLEAAQRYATA